MVGGDICLLMGWQCLNWLRRGEDGDVADIVPCGRCDLKVTRITRPFALQNDVEMRVIFVSLVA